MPIVTDDFRPKGLPTARTRSPTLIVSCALHGMNGRFSPSILITAKSVFGSVPTTFAANSFPSNVVTVMFVESSTTWLLVTMYPSGLMTTPEPALMPGGPNGGLPGGPGGCMGGPGGPGGPPKGPGGNRLGLRELAGSMTATFTTAGCTVATMSENPLLKASGTVADAGWGEKTARVPTKASTIRPNENFSLRHPCKISIIIKCIL